MLGASAALVLAMRTTPAFAASTATVRHNFTGDYLIGTWNCTTQAANGLAVRRQTYKAIQGGSAMESSGLTTTSQGRRLVEEARITDNAGYFRWVDVYTSKGWRSDHWFVKGVLHMSDILGGSRSFTLTQAGHAKYTLEVDSLMNPPVYSSCLRQ